MGLQFKIQISTQIHAVPSSFEDGLNGQMNIEPLRVCDCSFVARHEMQHMCFSSTFREMFNTLVENA